MTTTPFWDFRSYTENRWFRFLCLTLFCGAVFYIGIHWFVNVKSKIYDYEYVRLNQSQVMLINRIYFDSSSTVKPGGTLVTDTTTGTTNSLSDTLALAAPAKPHDMDSVHALKTNKVICYLINEFNDKWDKRQRDTVNCFLNKATPVEAVTFLAGTRFQVKSYFWLIGPSVYFEIILWAFFGVVCSLLFSLGLVSKNATTTFDNQQSVFDSSEIPYQVAKILYAPICTMVIVLGYNFFNGDNVVDIYSSKGVIVFAFVGGFYSSRIIALMDRLKEVVLPSNSTSTIPTTAAVDANPIKNLIIKLSADVVNLPETLQQQINNGIDNALVKLQPYNSVIELTATKPDREEALASTYKVPEIIEGIYKITALWQILIENEEFKFYAEMVTSIKPDTGQIIVTLKQVKK